MPFAELHHSNIYYEIEGHGPPLVFAHGAGGNHMSWWQQVPEFAGNYTCVVFDHPSFGQSTWSSDVDESIHYGDVAAGLLDHLGIDSCGFIAQSMGGWTAMGLVERAPEKVAALVLASTHGGVSTPAIERHLDARNESLSATRDSWMKRAADSFNPALGERAMREQPSIHYLYSEISALNPDSGQAAAARRRWGGRRAEMARGIDVPTLIISGQEDIVIPPAALEELHDLIPNSRLERVPEAGHSVYFERPAAFNRLLKDFLDENYPGG